MTCSSICITHPAVVGHTRGLVIHNVAFLQTALTLEPSDQVAKGPRVIAAAGIGGRAELSQSVGGLRVGTAVAPGEVYIFAGGDLENRVANEMSEQVKYMYSRVETRIMK